MFSKKSRNITKMFQISLIKFTLILYTYLKKYIISISRGTSQTYIQTRLGTICELHSVVPLGVGTHYTHHSHSVINTIVSF